MTVRLDVLLDHANEMSTQHENLVEALPAVPWQTGTVCRIGPERRFGYIEADGPGGLRRYIFVAGQTITHRAAATLNIGTCVKIRVVDDRRILQLELV